MYESVKVSMKKTVSANKIKLCYLLISNDFLTPMDSLGEVLDNLGEGLEIEYTCSVSHPNVDLDNLDRRFQMR